ncbi:DUF3558 family protein [Actinokineospora enzanensis]|uniref:DUF3558 family protein n=1 Tax=Actinokineospora enzanensis TaxID=155975 RepID=UPI0009FC8CD2|nr:DUF3558 family protein [Actinokineospora enzanensis]
MTTSPRRARTALVVTCAALTLAACADTTTGTATTPAGIPSNPSPTKVAPSTTKTSTNSSPLAALKPCELLTDAAKSQLGITGSGSELKLGGARTCEYRIRGENETTIFSAQLWDRAGLSSLSGNPNNTDVPDIAGRKSIQTAQGGGAGTCAVSISVTDHAMAAASVVAGVDTTKACQLARQTVELMEPQLP